MKIARNILLGITILASVFALLAWRYPEATTNIFGPWATLASIGFVLILFPLLFLWYWGVGGKFLSSRWEQSAKDGKDT
jgi:hypothetical protein